MENTRMFRRRKTAELERLLEDTPEAYYWVGFIAADGHISKRGAVKLTLAEKDIGHVSEFSRFIRYVGEAEDRCTVAAMNVPVVKALREKFGFLDSNKTENPMTVLPEDDDLFIAMVIGFIDGDGNITKQCGTRPDSAIRVKCHRSWQPWFERIHTRVTEMSSVSGPPGPHLVSRDRYTVLCWSDTRIVRFMKLQSLRLGLPVLQRKWSVIDENYVSRQETAKVNEQKVIQILEQGGAQADAVRETGLSDGGVSRIVKRLGLEYRRRCSNNRRKIHFLCVSPIGEKFVVEYGLARFCRENRLPESSLRSGGHNGWKVKRI